MSVSTLPHSVLRIADLGADGLAEVLALAAAMKQRPQDWRDALAGQTVACYFSKPSTRTRVSFETASYRLGALPLMLRPDELQLGRGEPIADTARVLSSYCAAIVIRTFAQDDVRQLAGAASVPVINALTDDHHPCQALADLLTLRERFGDLHGLKVAYVGDGNNVAASLMEAGALAGMHVAIAAPGERMPDPEVVAWARGAAEASGGSIALVTDPAHAVAGAHAVYTDVWVSMGDEAHRERRQAELAPYRVTSKMMDLARDEAVFLHCLPAHRGEEIDAAVIDGERSVVWRQAANRLPTEQALLHLLCTSQGQGGV
jgi:ornithine carbamoyltransferase